MSIVSYCRRAACTASADETLAAAAQRMEKEGIGLLVVTEDGRLAGVLTDRDVTLHAVAEERDAAATRIGEAMTRPPVALQRGDGLEDALARMASARVRRLPVRDGERVEGVVSADDLALLLAREIGGLGEVLVAQLPAGASRLPAPAPSEGRPHRAAEHYAGDVVTAASNAPAAQLARAMRQRAVGSVVVLGEDGTAEGLVTDRDLALRVAAAGLDPVGTTAAAVMSRPLVSAQPSDPLEEVVERMRANGVRRIPILREGRPVGIVSFDDLLVAFGRELDQLADCVSGEVRRARLASYPSRMRQEVEDRIEEVGGRLREAGDHTLRSLRRELDQVVERVGQAVRGGALRARSTPLTVGELMRTDVRTCTAEEALSEAARIMWERDCGCVPVLASDGSGRVVGMITDRDLCMAVYTKGARLTEMQVKAAMAGRVYAVHPEDPVSEAEAVMRTSQVRRLPVVDGQGHLRGILSLADLAEAAAGTRVPAGAVSPMEVGLVLEAVCRPHSALARA